MSMNKRTRKSIALTLGLVVGGMCASTNGVYAAEKEIVKAQKLNVRKGPSVKNDRIGALDRGMVVEIIETSNGWNKVKLLDGKEGWVSGKYTAKEKGTVIATNLNIRKGPSIETEKIGSLENETVIEILETEDNWYKVKFADNKEGWISGEYVLTESQEIEKEKEVRETTVNEVKKIKTENTGSQTSVKNEERVEKSEKETSNETTTKKSSRLMTVNASAYSGHNITATGTTPRWGTIAVDPSVIPYGTRVYIPKFDMVFIAEDCGGAIKGNKIDIFMNSESDCNSFGRQNIEIQILG